MNYHVSHESIIYLGNKLYQLAKDSNILEFENKLPEYTVLIEKHFESVTQNDLDQSELDNLQTVLDRHQKIIRMIDKHRELISKKLKHLHTGKEMQLLYPNK